MTIYSHSRLASFEQCPLKYKYRYIDKIKVLEKSIEAILGSAVHDSLEWLYLQVKDGEVPSIDDLISKYTEAWQKHFSDKVKIVKQELTAADYFNKGVEFIINYYTKHQPFSDNTIATEKKVIINLGEHKLQGYIDRLVHNLETDEIEIHDYKTANSMPTQKQIDNDRQLALYSIAIKEEFGNDKPICLTWHYLAHDIKVCSKRTNEQLEQLKKHIIELIEEIEATQHFPPYITKLCDWCEYKKICPAWDKQETLDFN